MTDIELSAIESLAKAATPGPWYAYTDGSIVWEKTHEIHTVCDSGEKNKNNAAFIAAANPVVILELIAELRARTALLEEVYSELGEKINGACNVCSTYTHKHWCYYPKLAKILGKPLDEFDTKFLAEIHRRDRG